MSSTRINASANLGYMSVIITVKPLILATLNFGIWVDLIILDPVILAFLPRCM